MLNAYSNVLNKTARIWSRPVRAASVIGDVREPWSERFKGSPFYKKAMALENTQAQTRLDDAERALMWSKRSVEDAEFRMKVAQVEKQLADWSFSQEGSEKLAFIEKLSECRHRSFREWSDYFKDSPFYKTAMALEVEDAKREAQRRRADLDNVENDRRYMENMVERAELEAAHAAWKLEQMGFSKTASAALVISSPKDANMPLSETTTNAFFYEVEEIEKLAGALSGRGAMAAIGGLGILGTGTGTYVGHKKGVKKGRQEGLRVGYIAGARRGFQAGQQYTVQELRRRMMQARSAISRGGNPKKKK